MELQALATTKAPNNLEAYDLVLRGRDLLSRLTRANNAEARELFKHAIEQDPTFAPAYVGLGRASRYAVMQGWAADPVETLELAQHYARKAISLDERSSGAYALLGQVLVQFGDYDRALDQLRRAVDLNPSDGEAYGGLAAIQLWRGDIQAVIDAGEILLQFSPELSAPDAFHVAAAHVLSNDGATAVKILQRSLERNPSEPNTNILLAAAYVEAGRKTDADRQASIVRQRFPWFSIDEFGSLLRDSVHREKLRSTLQKAGL
jgi:Flp pilus assembly protein TadD